MHSALQARQTLLNFSSNSYLSKFNQNLINLSLGNVHKTFNRTYTREKVCKQSCYKSVDNCSCRQKSAVDKLCSHCLFPVVVTSLEQGVDYL